MAVVLKEVLDADFLENIKFHSPRYQNNLLQSGNMW